MSNSNRSFAILVQPFVVFLRQPVLVLALIGTSLLAAWLIPYADNKVSQHVSVASTELAFLAKEMKSEAGPDFSEARQIHFRLVSAYVDRIENRSFGKIIGKVWPKYSVREQTKDALILLASPSDECPTQNKCALGDAAEQLASTATRWAGEKSGEPAFAGKVDITDLLASLVTFKQSVRLFKKHPDLLTAEMACMDSRLAAYVLVRNWPLRGRDEDVQAFAERLTGLQRELNSFAGTLDGEEKERIQHYASNVGDRLKFVETLSANGMLAARGVLLANLSK